MIPFLEDFYANKKTPEEEALPVAETAKTPPKRDVISLEAYAMGEDEEEDLAEYCSSPCGGCGCRS
jgi:hypothetical protein